MIQTGQRSTMNGGEKILGVEGGGTKTAWVLIERAGNELCVWIRENCLRRIFALPRPENCGRFLANCRRKLRPPAFFWRAAGRKKIDNRSPASVPRFGRRRKLWSGATAIRV